MTYKMKGFGGFGNSPAKQKSDTTKTYPKSYTKKDIEFLKEQHEDVVRYEDLDEKGKAIWRKNNQQLRSNPDTTRIKKKSPAKNPGGHKHDSEGKHELEVSRDKDGNIVKSKGDKSSTYTKSNEEKDFEGTGKTKTTYTNPKGNTEIRTS